MVNEGKDLFWGESNKMTLKVSVLLFVNFEWLGCQFEFRVFRRTENPFKILAPAPFSLVDSIYDYKKFERHKCSNAIEWNMEMQRGRKIAQVESEPK